MAFNFFTDLDWPPCFPILTKCSRSASDISPERVNNGVLVGFMTKA